ncbi:hypothetical protein AX14_005871 [Amanita brunnescens Koide BX004]|nr:hypothetical protein AX14_005871 [Amanita brunnescens Koide BX004]
MPPRRTPIPSGCDVSSRLSNETAKPHGEVTTVRQKSDIVSIKQVVNVKTYRTMETRSRVSPNGPPPRKIPHVREQEQPRRAVEDRTSQGIVNEQAQGIFSILLDEVGKGRRDYTITNKINDALLTPCSPEALAAPMPPMTLFPPVLHCLFDEPIFKLPAEQGIYNIAIGMKEEISVAQHSPEDLVVNALPTPPSAFQAQTMVPHSRLDEPKPSTRGVPQQSTLDAVGRSEKTSVARSLIKPPALMMPIHSLEDKAARKQSEVLKTSSREGACLERAAAYIQEHLSKCLPACNAFPSQSGRAMLPKTIDTGARQHNTDIVSKRTTNAITSLPHTRVAPTLPVHPLAHAAQAEIPCQWPNEVTLPPMSLIEGSHNIASNKVVQAALTPCLLQDKCLKVLLASAALTSPNDNFTPNKAGHLPTHLAECSLLKGDLSGLKLSNNRTPSQDVSQDKTSVTPRSPYVPAASSPLAIRPVQCPWADCQWAKPSPSLLLMKTPKEEEKWPNQEAISKVRASVHLYSPRPIVAIALLMLKPVDPPPARVPFLSSGLES